MNTHGYTKANLHEDIGALILVALALGPFVLPLIAIAYLIGRHHQR